jgi:hypothetical protein
MYVEEADKKVNAIYDWVSNYWGLTAILIGGGRKERGSKKIKYLFGFLEDGSEIQQEDWFWGASTAPLLYLSSFDQQQQKINYYFR